MHRILAEGRRPLPDDMGDAPPRGFEKLLCLISGHASAQCTQRPLLFSAKDNELSIIPDPFGDQARARC